jgi:putative addiction module killer protein
MEYEIETTDVFDTWLDEQTDEEAVGAIVARINRVRHGLFGDAERVGGKVTELKVDTGQGYRVYLTIRGRTVVILLMGGTKKTQKRDIKAAKKMVEALG